MLPSFYEILWYTVSQPSEDGTCANIGLYRDSFGEENWVCICRKGKVKLSLPELLTILFIL